jgi:hypothetical protein
MVLSPQDAAGALRDIEAAQARSAKLHGYARSAPQLLLWGVLWVIGCCLHFSPLCFSSCGRSIRDTALP